MAASNEEQLLSEVLRSIAREDAGLDAAHLEARVVEACSAGTTVRLKPDPTHPTPDPTYVYWAIAAAIAIAALVPGIALLMRDDIPTPAVKTNVVATAEPAFAPPALRRGEPTRPASAPPALRRGGPTRPTNPTPPTNPSSVGEFVPLMPMTERELAGPFQLVRVQMPRASLGALRSPLELPNELVEADVLLGEDGMARAIRVSTGGSVYPWRSR